MASSRCRARMWGMAGVDFKALREAELLGRGHHGPNDPRERGPGPAVTLLQLKEEAGK